MLRTFGRLSLVVVVALLALMGASFGPGRLASMTTSSAFAQPRLGPGGISAAAAARSLNAMSRENAAHSTKSLTDVHFILNWLPNVEFAGLWMAEKQNVWAKNGLHLSYTPWSQSVTPE